MASSIPSRLLESREFLALRQLAKLVLRALWRRGHVQRWPTEQHLLLTLQCRGMFLAMDAHEWAGVRDELVAAAALVVEGEEFVLPILSGDWPLGQRKPRPQFARGPQGGLTGAERSDKHRHPERYAGYVPKKGGRPSKEGDEKPVAVDPNGTDATGFEGAETAGDETRRSGPPSARALAPATPPTTPPVGGGVVEGGEGSGPKAVATPIPERRRIDRRTPPPGPSGPRLAVDLEQLGAAAAGTVVVTLLRGATEVFTASEGAAGVFAVGRDVIAAKLSEHDVSLVADHWRAEPVRAVESIARSLGLSARALGRFTPLHSSPDVWREALTSAQQWRRDAVPGPARVAAPALDAERGTG